MNTPPEDDVVFEDCHGAPDEQSERIRPQFVGVAELVTGYPNLLEPVIHDMLRLQEVGNVIASPKTKKSWMVLGIGLSVCTGRMVFNRFRTERGRVLIVDNELHKNTIAKRIPAVAGAMGITLDELDGWLSVESLRGRDGPLPDLYQLESYFRAVECGYFKLIILDALYRFMPRDHDENSNAQVTQLYNRLDHYAKLTGAAFLLVHHASKGIQSGKSITDVGAGAGAISRAADAHLILRDHEEDGAVVLESAVRSWKPVEPLCLRWEYPVWKTADDLDPEQLRQASRRRREKADPDPAPEPTKKWTPAEFATAFVGNEPTPKELILAKAVSAGLTDREAKRLLLLAVAEMAAFQHPDQKRKPYFARREPTVFDGEKVSHTRAHSPHTPHAGGKPPRGAGGARDSAAAQGGTS